MKVFHLFAFSALFIFFSGRPVVPAAPEKITVAPYAKDSVSKTETSEVIPWTNEQRLDWNDFLSEPVRGTDAVASTSTSLGISYQLSDGQLVYHITCSFNKEKSWTLLKTGYILSHEQGHFDITEIFARKLNEALQQYQFNRRTFKKDINRIYQSVVQQKENFQKKYDEATDHSRKRKEQYDWCDTIDHLLAETQPYSNYP